MTAIILAGGKSRRFGRDKAFVKVKGIPIIKRQIKILAKAFKKIIIVTNSPGKSRSFYNMIASLSKEGRDKYRLGGVKGRPFGSPRACGMKPQARTAAKSTGKPRALASVKIIRDIIPGKGPLGGIYSGLKASSSFYNFVVACDMPFLNINLMRYLRKKAVGYDAVAIRFDNKLHPLYAVYTKNCLEAVGVRVHRDSLKLSGLLRNVKTKIISERETKRFDRQGRCLTNLNTLKEYRSLYA